MKNEKHAMTNVKCSAAAPPICHLSFFIACFSFFIAVIGEPMSECVLSEQTHQFISSRKWEVVVLPFGATEPHNLHMPYGTDNFEVEAVGRRACERAYGRGANVLL